MITAGLLLFFRLITINHVWRAHILFTLFIVCGCLRIVVSNKYCVVFFVFVCLRLVSCVPNVANFPGFSILDCRKRLLCTED
jgi:hypothetical protein